MDNFLKNRLNIKTYTNFHTITNIKTVETEIQNEYKSIESRIKNVVLNQKVVKKEQSKILSELTRGYTLFLKQLNDKQKEVEKQIAEEKKFMLIQKQNAAAEKARKAKEAEAKRVRILAWQDKMKKAAADEKKRKELEEQERKRKVAEEKKALEEKQKRDKEISEIKVKFKNIYKKFIKSPNGDIVIEAKKLKNVLIEKGVNTTLQGWMIIKMDLLFNWQKLKDDTTPIEEGSNSISIIKDLVKTFHAHNNKLKQDEFWKYIEADAKKPPSVRQNLKRLVIIDDATFTSINGKLRGLETALKLFEKKQIKKKVEAQYNEEITEINRILNDRRSLHDTNIYNESYKSKNLFASAARKVMRKKK